MTWAELWDGVVKMLWHCRHERIAQCAAPDASTQTMMVLQACLDCGAIRWLPGDGKGAGEAEPESGARGARAKGWRMPAGLRKLAAAMPISHTLMTSETSERVAGGADHDAG